MLPVDVPARARVRAIASYVAADIQPLQNTGLDPYFEKEVGKTPSQPSALTALQASVNYCSWMLQSHPAPHLEVQTLDTDTVIAIERQMTVHHD